MSMVNVSLVLKALTEETCEMVRVWRNQDLRGLRTPILLTDRMQHLFYRDVICDRRSPHRYWGVHTASPVAGSTPDARDHLPFDQCVAMTGLTNIQWENGLAEIALIVNPLLAGPHGIGTRAVALVLGQAFEQMRLATVCGECYDCNPATEFWGKITRRYGGQEVNLPRRKFWGGRLWGAYYFSISEEQYWAADTNAAGKKESTTHAV